MFQDEAGGSGQSTPRSSPFRHGIPGGPTAEREISREALASNDDTDAGGNNSQGRLEFNIKYDLVDSTLKLKVIRAVDLPAKDFISGTSDPYVKIMLLPDKQSKLSTSIKRRNLNPRWNEIFDFEGNRC